MRAVSEPIHPAPAGQVITFYSYKGGTGRTMALANVGSLLAQRSDGEYETLMIDWDLEAPGLHKYFPTQRGGAALNDHRRPGLIELLSEIWTRSRAVADLEDPTAREEAVGRIVHEMDLLPYVTATDVPHLHLMKAGALDRSYAGLVNAFRWDEFYQCAPWAITALAEALARRFRYVLVDSRTGLTDTSGICTMLLPEKLVVVFTPNAQSLEGVADLVQRAIEHRRSSDDLRPLTVYPLPSRIETTEPGERDAWRLGNESRQLQGWQRLFESTLTRVYGLRSCNLAPYFDEVQIQHQPYYAYGEKIAVQIERGTEIASLPKSYQRFTDWLVNRTSAWEDPAEAAAAAALRESQELGRRAERVYAGLSSDDDRLAARRIFQRLVTILGEREVGEFARRIAKEADLGLDPVRAQRIIEPFASAGILSMTAQPLEVQIADDRLIRSWARLSEWIESDRVFLTQRQQICQRVEAWKDSEMDPGLLLRGRALGAALDMSSTRSDDLTPEELRYIRESETFAALADARQVSAGGPSGEFARTMSAPPAPPIAASGHGGSYATASLALHARSRRAWLIGGTVAAVMLVGAVMVIVAASHDDGHAEFIAAAAALAGARGDPAEAGLLLATLDDRDGDVALERARVLAAMPLPVAIVNPEQAGISSASVSASESHVLTTARDGSAVISTIGALRPTRLVYGGRAPLRFGSFRADGRALVLVEAGGGLVVLTDSSGTWGGVDGAVPVQVTRLRPSGEIVTAAFAPDGTLRSVDRRGPITSWRSDGCCRWTGVPLRSGLGAIRLAQFSADGTTLAVAGAARGVTLVELPSLQRREVADSSVAQLALSSDGSHLATVTSDGAIRVHDQLGRVVWEQHAPDIGVVALSSFGSRIATAAANAPTQVARIGDRAASGDLTTLGGVHNVAALAFGIDSSMIVTAADSSIRVWRLDAPRPAATASWPELRQHFATNARSCLSVATRKAVLGESDVDAERAARACEAGQVPMTTIALAPDTSDGGPLDSTSITVPPRSSRGGVRGVATIDSTTQRILRLVDRTGRWTGVWSRSDSTRAEIELQLSIRDTIVFGSIRWSELEAKGEGRIEEAKIIGTFDRARLHFLLRALPTSPWGSDVLRLLIRDERLTLEGTVVGAKGIEGSFRGAPVVPGAQL